MSTLPGSVDVASVGTGAVVEGVRPHSQLKQPTQPRTTPSITTPRYESSPFRLIASTLLAAGGGVTPPKDVKALQSPYSIGVIGLLE